MAYNQYGKSSSQSGHNYHPTDGDDVGGSSRREERTARRGAWEFEEADAAASPAAAAAEPDAAIEQDSGSSGSSSDDDDDEQRRPKGTKKKKKFRPIMGVIDFVSDNAVSADPQEREASLREKCPDLLLDDERVVFAFKDRGGKGRDSSSFTTHRILIKDKQGLTGAKTEYVTAPYSAIKAYSIETAGKMDSDSELKVYVSGLGRLEMDFSTDVNVFELNHHLNRCVLEGKHGSGFEAVDGATASGAAVKEGSASNVFNMMGSDNVQIDAAEVEAGLKETGGILLSDESVELAFKCGRDSFVLTSHRILRIDVQGMSGTKVEYFTLLWSTVRAFAIETAGSFLDRDAELTLFTQLPDRASSAEGFPRKERTRIGVDFRKGQADIFAVQKFFADKLLGPDEVDASESAVSMAGEADGGSGSMFSWMGDDSRMVDAEEMDRQYHSSPPILQGCEKVEMAFKGRRDLMLFTSKRLVFVDVQGFSGKKVEYMSVPWSSVQCFGVKSAGSFLDKDSELMIWTDFDDCFFPPKPDEDSPPPPPIPRYSYLELDFQKDKVDLLAVQRYLSERCLRVEGGRMVDGVWVPNMRPYDVPVSQDVMNPGSPGALSNFVSMLGDDARAIDPEELNEQMHGADPILQEDEKVVLAYKAGRDTFVMTTKRIFIIDKKGFTGKRVAYISVPYTSIRAFAVESAGSFDNDSEVKIWTKTYWSVEGGVGNKLDQDLRKGKADIVAIQEYLATQVIGTADGSSSLAPDHTAAEAGKVDSFLSFVSDNAVALEPSKVKEQLTENVPILQSDEDVDAVYKIGRDMCVFTTKRILAIDRQGLTGKKVEYRSFPLRYVRAYRIRTAGKVIGSAEVEVYSDGSRSVEQDLAKSSSDVWTVQKILANKTLK